VLGLSSWPGFASFLLPLSSSSAPSSSPMCVSCSAQTLSDRGLGLGMGTDDVLVEVPSSPAPSGSTSRSSPLRVVAHRTPADRRGESELSGGRVVAAEADDGTSTSTSSVPMPRTEPRSLSV